MSGTVFNLLINVPVFSGIPPEVFVKLLDTIKERPLKKGEIIFNEGDQGKAFYVIKSGAIEILKGDLSSSKQVRLAERRKGDFFGEMALLEDSPRFASARAMQDSVVLEISRDDFKNMISENPSMALEVMGALSSRLREADLQMIRDLEKKNEQLEKTNMQLIETTQKLQKSNESIRSANKFLETIISASQFFIIVTDNKGMIFIFNNAAKDVFGYDFNEAAGCKIGEIISPLENDSLWDEIETSLDTGKTWSGEILSKAKGSRKLIIELVGARVIDEKGEIFTTLYMGRDITKEKNLERQMIDLDRMATRGEMAGEIAHELNNYLALVQGNLELLQMNLEMGKHETNDKRIASIQKGLEGMTKFTDGLMMYSSPEIQTELFNLNMFLESELFFLKPQHRFNSIEIVCDFDPELPPVNADKSQLQQVLINLLNNAADATLENGRNNRKITIKTRYLPKDDSILFSIIDNGNGFTDDSLGRVFRQHFTTKKQGHGFGLLAVKRIIKSHRGKVWAENNPEGGAIFNIQIPSGTPTKTGTVKTTV